MALFPKLQKFTLTTPDGARMEGLKIGRGPIPMLVIAGGGDGVTMAHEGASQLAYYFRGRNDRYTLLYLSRREPVPADFGVERHAEDFIWALQELDWGPCVLECNSAGGPIGQQIAVKRPDLVKGLILSCTFHRADDKLRTILGRWIGLAKAGNWAEFNWDSTRLTVTDRMAGRIRPFKFLLGLRRPKNPERVVQVLTELLTIDHRAILPRIACPTLVIGGQDDEVTRPDIQTEMAELIPNSRLKLYPGYKHGNDVENPAYNREVDLFVDEVLKASAASVG